RRAVDLPVHERGRRQDAAPLLDDGLSGVRAEGSVYARQGAPDLAVGARGRSRDGAGPARPQPGQDARAPPDRGASVRDHQGVDGSHALPNENVAESGDRNGAARTGLQHETGDADSGYWRIDGRHAGLRRILVRTNQPRTDDLRTHQMLEELDSRNFAAPIRQVLADIAAHAI